MIADAPPMNCQKLLNLAYRCGRRLVREFRKRGNGLDTRFDAWLYRRSCGRTDGRERVLRWATLAPWEPALPSRSAVPDWCTPAEAAAVVTAADRACVHEFDLLGSGPVQFGDRINWHADFKSKYLWDGTLHHSRIDWGDLPQGVDIKVPWELSRCMHFATLGLADWITGDIRYYDEWKAQVADWIHSNPVGRGVNWTCAMDVAMRAVNWLNAAMLFESRIQADSDEAFFEAFCEALWHHGHHIDRNLEWAGPGGALPGNHFLADLTGLLAIGAFFRDKKKGNVWLRFAKRWIAHEILRQVNPDGCNHETSTSYHRMVMEMFLWSDTLATRMREPFGEGFRQRLDLMAGFVTAYSAPGGAAAQFGDNDSGRLLWAGLDDGTDHRYLTRAQCGFGGRLNRFLLRGGMEMPGSDETAATSYPDSGFYFMRHGPAWVGLRAGRVSHGGAHAHCDQLSFVFNLAGQSIIVDRGTGIYTPDAAKRNRYRSTAYHSVAQINDWEQNDFGMERSQVFQMPDHTKARVIRQEEGATGSKLEAEHHGFERHRLGLRHTRKIRLNPECLEIEDLFDTIQHGDHLVWNFHFAPGLIYQHRGQKLLVVVDGFELQLTWNFPSESIIEQVNHSPAYGVEVPAPTLRVTAAVEATPKSYRFLFDWRPSR